MIIQTFSNAYVTIKNLTGLRVRFLGIGRRVKVGDRAVTITFESALHFIRILSIRSGAGYGGRAALCSVPVEWASMSG